METNKTVAVGEGAVPVKYIRETPDEYKLKRFAKGDWTDVRVIDAEVNGILVPWEDGVAVMDLKKKKVFAVLTKEEAEMTPIGANQTTEPVKYIRYEQFDIVKCMLGFAMQLPKGEEAHLAPRSSTFGKWGFLQTNSVGVVDNSYCGDNDEWMQQFYATRGGVLCKFDRVGQFRTMDKMPEKEYKEVKQLGNPDRKGFGKGTEDIK